MLADYLAIWLPLYKNITELLGHAAHIEARKTEIRSRANASHQLHFIGSFRRLRFLGCVSRLDPRLASSGRLPHALISQVAPPGLSSHWLIAWVHCIASVSKADKPLFMKSTHLPQNDLMPTYRNAHSRLSTPENPPFHAVFVGA